MEQPVLIGLTRWLVTLLVIIYGVAIVTAYSLEHTKIKRKMGDPRFAVILLVVAVALQMVMVAAQLES